MNEFLFIGLAALLVIAILLSFIQKRGGNQDLLGLFGLPGDYRVIGTDLGGSKDQLYLRADGLTGAPDVAFFSSRRDHWVAGEYKSRKYRGQVRPHERYQVVLYIGMLRSQFRTQKVTGAIRYRDRYIEIHFDPELYRKLVNMAPELIQAEKTWRPPNKKPVEER